MADIEQKIIITTETNAEETAKKVDNLVESTEDSTQAQQKATKSTKAQQEALGELSPALSNTVQGIQATGKALWALVANPIVATIALIVGGLYLLFKAFASTNDGADKLDQVMAGISATIDIVRDRILKVGEAIVKFLTGDFKGAIATGYEAVSGFGDEVAKEFKKAADATKALQEVEDAMRDLGVSRAKLNRDLAESKEIITDETASYADKKKAIEEVKKAEALQTEQELSNARKKLKAIQELNALSDTSDEDLQKEADARSALYNLEQKSAEDKRAIRKTEIRADKEETARLKELSDARKALFKERYDAEKKLLQDVQNLQDKSEESKLARQKERDLAELRLLEQKGIDIRKLLVLNSEKYNILEDELKSKRAQEIIEADKLRDEELRNADEKRNKEKNDSDAEQGKLNLAGYEANYEKKKAIDEAELQHQKEIELLKRDVLTSGLDLVKNLFEKNKKIQKAVLITQGIIGLTDVTRDTIRGVSAELAKGVTGIPGAVLIGAKGAINAASIIASTAKGLQALGGGGGISDSGSSSGSGGGATSAAPQVNFQNSSENQISNAVNQSQQNIKVSVLESDISKAQNNVQVLVNENSF